VELLTAIGNSLVKREYLRMTPFEPETMRTGPAGSITSVARVSVRGWGLLVVVTGGRIFLMGICRIMLSGIL